MSCLELSKQRDQIAAGTLGVLDQPLELDHVENRNSGRGGNRIAAERVEVARPSSKLRQKFWARGHSGNGMAVSHRLAHGDEIGDEPVTGKTPHLPAAAAEAGLHLVGDEQCPGGASGFDRRAQKAGRIGKHAIA